MKAKKGRYTWLSKEPHSVLSSPFFKGVLRPEEIRKR
jgi:hypothetical protein